MQPCINPLRSTRCVAKTFKLDARLDPGAVLQKLTGVNLRLGLVWMPAPQIVLSNEAGAVLRECMLSHRRFFREDGLKTGQLAGPGHSWQPGWKDPSSGEKVLAGARSKQTVFSVYLCRYLKFGILPVICDLTWRRFNLDYWTGFQPEFET